MMRIYLCLGIWIFGMVTYAGSAEILPESFLRGYDPVTILYSSEVGPEGGGPLDDPSPHLTVDPPVPGEFRFIDAKTIQFRPADPRRSFGP